METEADFGDSLLPNQIICIEKHCGYTLITKKGDSQKVIGASLDMVEKNLPTEEFSRVHKGYIVNLREILEVVQKRGAQIILTNGRSIPIAKRRKKDLLDKLKIKSIIV